MKTVNLIFLLIGFICQSQNKETAIKDLEILQSKTNAVRGAVKNLIKLAGEKLDAEPSLSKKETLRFSLDSLWNISDRNDIEALKITIAYCRQHPSCPYSFDLVASKVQSQSGKNFYADFENLYKNASDDIKNSESGKQLAENLTYFKQSMTGSLAPHFSGFDANGIKIFLDEFVSKKYVLIDFWASWCSPCREEIPFLNELHKKYYNQGFEILSISTDEDPEKWKNAITKEQIENWRHFSSVQNNSTVTTDYFVSGIPHKVLIDKTGKIIGKWKSSGELNKNELKNQLMQIFGY